jgi:hypothetical protein
MTMHTEQDNFEQLRRLLALKRHEQPPPGYFNNFSRQVVARIKAGETAASESFFERVLTRVPWLQSIWTGFEAKPIVAGAFGISVCSLLIFGLVSSERIDSNAALLPVGGPAQPVVTMQAQSAGMFERTSTDYANTGSVFTAHNRYSIFDEVQPHVQPAAQPVNFSPSSAN